MRVTRRGRAPAVFQVAIVARAFGRPDAMTGASVFGGGARAIDTVLAKLNPASRMDGSSHQSLYAGAEVC
jgi:acetylornithine/succinyldiaminopimelate/putrescine aminotransferase